ncbi:MAG: Na/Pi cotransporter family protein [Rhodospirillales bacterium]
MELLINLLGGVALLLWGIRMVRTGVTRGFGSRLRKSLAGSATNRFSSFAAGLGITAILQSSAATALIAASFAGRGYLTVAIALAVMLGADVGTTLVVQVLSFDVYWLAPLLIAAGVIGFNLSDESTRRALSRIAIGLGLMLLSLQMVTTVSAPLRHSEALAVLLQPLTAEPILAVIVAALLTWLAHSSVAVILLVASLAAVQAISVQLALALVIGANLGSALIAVALNWHAVPAAKRVPVGNLLVKLAGVVIGIALLPWLQPFLAMISADPVHLVANFHTAFNLALALAFLPLTGQLERLVTSMVPDSEETAESGAPRYLDDDALDTPAEALVLAARETLRMGDEVEAMLNDSFAALVGNDMKSVKAIEAADDTVDGLHEAIKLYLTRATEQELDAAESARTIQILSFSANLEHIGDIIDKNLMELAAKKIKARTSFSDEGLDELRTFHKRIADNFRLAMNVFVSGDVALARQLLAGKTEIRDLELRLVERHYHRIAAGRAESIETSSLHLDILRDFKRINSHLTAVAYPILEQAGELRDSRLKKAEKADAGDTDAARLRPAPLDVN